MAKDLDVTCGEWCDLVFEGKNKEYGAYVLRKSSSRRHITAYLIIIGVDRVVYGIADFYSFFNTGEGSGENGYGN